MPAIESIPARQTVIVFRGPRVAFWMMVIALALNILAVLGWTWGALQPVNARQAWLFLPAVLLQVFGVGLLIAATWWGIILLVRKVRPLVWVLLPTFSFPIAAVVLLIEFFVIWTALGQPHS
ncbi:hypothetical protein [Psychromicrobium xiongbiense]|uniref:hypothetical protein n=1 Tax=Psychromicrobium xiongbiense TaxID=3051184 RepID=UPI0025523056|nr:hypothetical protein [Psychromicrobium sp. YIM S02556]